MCSNEYFWLFLRGWTRNFWPGNAHLYVVIFTDSCACLKFLPHLIWLPVCSWSWRLSCLPTRSTCLRMLTRVRFFSPALVRACEINRCWNARPVAVFLADSCACLQATPWWIYSPGCGCYPQLLCTPAGNTEIDMLTCVQLSRRLSCVSTSSTRIDMLACVPHFSSRCIVVVVVALCCYRVTGTTAELFDI